MGNSESTTRCFARELPNSRMKGCGPIYVSEDSVVIPDENANLRALFKLGLSQSASKPFLGTRTKDASGKVGDYEWITYKEASDKADRFASGLKHIAQIKRQDIVGLFSKNRMEWLITEIACNRMSYNLVPLYDTLGPDVIPYILNHTNMRILVCSGDLVKNILLCKDSSPDLQYLISYDAVSDRQKNEAKEKGLVLFSMREVEDIGSSNMVDEDPPHADDIATICYTSGTTGNPKGAILTHRNMASAAYALNMRIETDENEFVHLSYLPLPHVFERTVLSVVQTKGGSAGFYQGDVLHLMDDLATLKPNIFVSVPRLFNRVYDKIIQGVSAAGGLKKMLFDYAYATKSSYLKDGYTSHALWDKLVFEKIRMVLGGKVQFIVSGSAPLSPQVKDFLKIAFSCQVEEGYGLTETCAGLTVSIPENPSGPHVGIPIPNVQIRLVDVSEMNYTSDDKPRPRGEICVRGPNVFSGYFKDEEKTKECLTRDRWFHTGDIGCWNKDGTLSIIDRKKNIFKLAQGEYVASEKIENLYAKNKYVAQIFVYGDSLKSCLVAVVVPDPEIVLNWANSNNIPNGQDLKAMVQNPALKKEIVDSMQNTGKECKLNGFEFVRGVHLHYEPFSVENNLATPTFKLKRPQLKEQFQKQIDALYAAL